jgi:transposase
VWGDEYYTKGNNTITVHIRHLREKMTARRSISTMQAIVAEIGTDMSDFPSAKHLSSWDGLCPGNNESAG